MEGFVDPETPRGVGWGGITMRTFSLLSQNSMVMIGLKLLWCLLIANRCDKSSLEDIPSCFYDSLTFWNLKGVLSWDQNLEATIVSAIFKKLMQHSSDGPPPGDLAFCYMSLWRCWGGGCFLPLLVMVVAQWWWTVHFSIGIFFTAQVSPVVWLGPWPPTPWMLWEHVWWIRESYGMARALATQVPWTAYYRWEWMCPWAGSCGPCMAY